MPPIRGTRGRYSSPTLPECIGVEPSDEAKLEFHARVQALKVIAGELITGPYMAEMDIVSSRRRTRRRGEEA
jgi:hypothetical protein